MPSANAGDLQNSMYFVRYEAAQNRSFVVANDLTPHCESFSNFQKSQQSQEQLMFRINTKENYTTPQANVINNVAKLCGKIM